MDYFKKRRETLEDVLNKAILERDQMLQKAVIQKNNLRQMMQAKKEAYDHMALQLLIMQENLNKKILDQK